MESGLLKEVVVGQKPLLELRSKEYRSSFVEETQEKEKRALLQQLRRLIHFVCTGENYETDSGPDIYIVDEILSEVHLAAEDDHSSGFKNHLVVKGNSIIYQAGQKRYERYSPMLTRLATILKAHSKAHTNAA